MEIKVIATTGRAKGQAVEIRAAKFFVGQHENCQLRPDIEGLAGIHALIEGRDNRLYLRDFGAEGGTGVNDRVLHARETEVFDGDLIQVGPMVLTLSVKARGEDRRVGHLHAPDGWPFLEGEHVSPLHPSPILAPVAAAPRLVPEPIRDVSPARPSPDRPGRLFQPSTTVRAEPVLAVKVAPTLAAGATPGSGTFDAIPKKATARRAIACRTVDEVLVVSLLSSDLNEEETVSPVRHELRSLLDDEIVASRVVIDMAHTRYLSSRAVGVLLAHYQALERVGSTMRVCGVSKEVKPVLDQMRLSMLIDVHPTVEDAVNSPWD